jgi:hypothetical protein
MFVIETEKTDSKFSFNLKRLFGSRNLRNTKNKGNEKYL